MSIWWKTWKFWVIAGVAVLAGVVVLVLQKVLADRFKDKLPKEAGFGGLPAAPPLLQEAADRAYEEALTAKAESKAKTEEKKAQLAEISKMDDKKQRRAAMADFMRG